MTDPRRLIPRTDMVLADVRLATALQALGHDRVKLAVMDAQQRARDGDIAPQAVIEAALAQLSAPVAGLRPVINATGVIVHTNLGRAPLSPAARRALTDAAGYTDVEFDLDTGQRARRGRATLQALAEQVPAADLVHVVNNTAAALLLSALALSGGGREIIISRGELVEIGDGFRIPELLASTGAILREVGTTNRTNLRDYTDAVSERTGFILKVHPSNFEVQGFTASVAVADLTNLGVPVIADIGSGLLHPHSALPGEPDVTSSLAAGADLVLASADKLLGGPQAGLIFGRADLIERLRRHPAARALRVDKLTLAALQATVSGAPSPLARALAADSDQLMQRARAIALSLSTVGIEATCIAAAAAVGGGGAPGVTLASAAISLPENFARPLRRGDPAVVGRIERGRCLLDLRAVEPAQDSTVLAAVIAAHRLG